MRIQSLDIKFLLSHRTKVRETTHFVNFYYQKSAFLKSILSCKKLLNNGSVTHFRAFFDLKNANLKLKIRNSKFQKCRR